MINSITISGDPQLVRFTTASIGIGRFESVDDFSSWFKEHLVGFSLAKIVALRKILLSVGADHKQTDQLMEALVAMQESLHISANGVASYEWCVAMEGVPGAVKDIVGRAVSTLCDFAHKRAYNPLYDYPPAEIDIPVFEELANVLSVSIDV